MKEQFINKRFNSKSVDTINKAVEIIEDYMAQGHSLSIRQLYYQFVSRGYIENDQKQYKRMVKLIADARLAGLVDWSAIEDRDRNLMGGDGGFENVEQYFQSIGTDYDVRWWEGQDNYVEVWVEKKALEGVVSKTCSRHSVSYFSCKGYSSQSEQYKAGKRFLRMQDQGKDCYLLHLGDHDPSGIDMTRDNNQRISMFANNFGIQVNRIALNMDQVEEQKPPPNPAKENDSRYAKYVEEHGKSCWELDALDPTYLDNLIDKEIKNLIDIDVMEARKELGREGRAELEAIANNYDEIKNFINENGLY